ncbi:DMT family transporter [Vibrio astriarenae]|uniref:DMT family transporter n=1 Tax=Vibrio astriarenae TaxID=1481923 RepID=UPI003734D59E
MISRNEHLPYKRIFQSNYFKGLGLALAGTALMSFKPVLIKIAYQFGGNVQAVMLLRAISSLPIYLIVLYTLISKHNKSKSLKQDGWKAALLGVFGYYVTVYLDLASLNHISAQLERLIIFLYPSLIILLSWILYKQQPTKRVVIAVITGYLGVIAIVIGEPSSGSSELYLGSSLAFASAFVFACYLLSSKPLISRMGSQLFTSIGMASASVAILLHFITLDGGFEGWNPTLVGLGVTLGLVCTVLPAYLIAAGMEILTPAEVGLTANIGPFITTGAAVYVLGETFTYFHMIGLVLVTLSVVAMRSK